MIRDFKYLSRVCVFFFFTVSASIYMRNGHRTMNSMKGKGKSLTSDNLTKSATKNKSGVKEVKKYAEES